MKLKKQEACASFSSSKHTLFSGSILHPRPCHWYEVLPPFHCTRAPLHHLLVCYLDYDDAFSEVSPSDVATCPFLFFTSRKYVYDLILRTRTTITRKIEEGECVITCMVKGKRACAYILPKLLSNLSYPYLPCISTRPIVGFFLFFLFFLQHYLPAHPIITITYSIFSVMWLLNVYNK